MIEQHARDLATVCVVGAAFVGLGILTGLMIISDWKAQKFVKPPRPQLPTPEDETIPWWKKRQEERRTQMIEGTASILSGTTNPDKPEAPKRGREIG